MNRYLCILLVLFVLRAGAGGQSLTVVPKPGKNDPQSSEFTIVVPKDTLAVVSVITALSVKQPPESPIQDVETKQLILSPGKYNATVIVSDQSTLNIGPPPKLLAFIVEKGDTSNVLYLDTKEQVVGFSFKQDTSGAVLFRAKIADRSVPVYRVESFPKMMAKVAPTEDKDMIEAKERSATEGPVMSLDQREKKLNTLVIPHLSFREASLREAVDFIKKKAIELIDAEKNPLPYTPIVLSPKASEDTERVTYSGENVPLLVAIAGMAENAGLELYLTKRNLLIVGKGEPLPASAGKDVRKLTGDHQAPK